MATETSSLHTSEEDDNSELFSTVLSSLNVDKLPSLTRAVFQHSQQQFPPNDIEISVGPPIYGSYYVVFPLNIDNGPRWAIKVPINGTVDKWDELSASALTSEANTMLLLKRETTIPLPNVLDYSPTTQNTLGCPYILMSFIPGVPLYEVWFGHRFKSANPESTREYRHRALEGIAASIIQLGKFSFQQGGRLLFQDNGELSGVGSMRVIDQKAILDRWLIHQDPDDNPIYAELAPSKDWRRYYTFMLDLHPESEPYPRGLVMFLRHLISLVPEPNSTDTYVLAHPDFDIQNFIVSEDGTLQGIIDWDGVAAVPRSLGNESYPGWLTRDWDPVMYGYRESMEHGVEPEGVWEDSLDCLAEYRSVYRGLIANHIAKSNDVSHTNSCQMSLITENLAIAAHDPRCRNAILHKILQEIWSVAGQEEQPTLMDVAALFSEGRLSPKVLQTINSGFTTLLSREQL